MCSDELVRFIDASAWAVGLTASQRDRLLHEASDRTFATGATVCSRGAPSTQWLGVMDGMLKVESVSVEGRSTSFAGVSTGAWFGEGAVLKNEPRPYAVIAIRDSRVAFVPSKTFFWLLDESRSFSHWLIGQLNARLGHYIALIETFRFQDATGRVAYCLFEFFNPRLFPGTDPVLTISQEEIAKLSGLSRPNANRALHNLENAGLIQMRYGTIRILDLPRLAECYRRK